jgi:hypothetical protein
MLDRLRAAGFDIETRNHAEAILTHDFADPLADLVGALLAFRIQSAEIVGSGGGEAPSTRRLRGVLAAAGWAKHNFRIETLIDGRPRGRATSHEIDHIRRTPVGTLALEIEWNNKDPFFDRDLENFQRLHAQTVISLGSIVTRGARLQAAMPEIVAENLRAMGVRDEGGLAVLGVKDRTARQREQVARAMARGEGFAGAFARGFVADKYGAATTHWAKLAERTARGVGNPCPLLLIGLPLTAVGDYSAASPEL